MKDEQDKKPNRNRNRRPGTQKVGGQQDKKADEQRKILTSPCRFKNSTRSATRILPPNSSKSCRATAAEEAESRGQGLVIFMRRIHVLSHFCRSLLAGDSSLLLCDDGLPALRGTALSPCSHSPALAQTVHWDPPGGQLGFNQVGQISLVFENCEPDGEPAIAPRGRIQFGRPPFAEQPDQHREFHDVADVLVRLSRAAREQNAASVAFPRSKSKPTRVRSRSRPPATRWAMPPWGIPACRSTTSLPPN